MGDAFGQIIAVLSGSSVKSHFNDDKVDRMNHLWTVFLLVMFAILTLTTQYVGEPIKCWHPAQFEDSWEDYTNSICWISNTYYIPMDDTIPIAVETREDKELSYYQWTPIILLFLAMLFKIPNLLWNSLNDYVGIDIDKLVRMAVETQWSSSDEKDSNVDNLVGFMHLWIKTYQPYKKGRFYKMKQKVAKVCFIFGKRAGNFLASLYMAIKLLYCFNVVMVFFVLNGLLSFEFNVFGFEILDYFVKEGEMKEIPVFPRVTLCDFEIRQLQNIQRFSVQCVLPVNLFNEKIFIVLWFWFFLIACFTFGSVLVWAHRFALQNSGAEYVKKYLKISRLLQSQSDKNLCKDFINDYLRADGVFILRILEKNSSDLVVGEIVVKLYTKFKDDVVP